MKKTVGKPTETRTALKKPIAFKAIPPKTLRPNAKKTTLPKRQRNIRTYPGPTDYEGYLEPNGLGTVSEETPAESERAAESGKGFSIFSMLGGIDGIIGIMTKANQVFKLFQQMGPMFKLISSFASAKATTASLKPGAIRHRPRHRKARK